MYKLWKCLQYIKLIAVALIFVLETWVFFLGKNEIKVDIYVLDISFGYDEGWILNIFLYSISTFKLLNNQIGLWDSEDNNNLFMTSKNETTNSPIHELKVLQNVF